MEHHVAATRGIRSDLEPKEPVLPWVVGNVARLAVYLAFASFISAVGYGLLDPPRDFFGVLFDVEILWWAYTFFIIGALAGVPGTILWLMALASLPPELPAKQRRILAIATSLLIQIVLLGVFLSQQAFALAVIFGILFPASAAFVVRLRERRPASLSPPEG